MTCSNKKCCSSETLLTKYPEKQVELEKYIDSLDLTDDLDKNRGFLIQTLHKAQEIFGYLPLELQGLIGEKLRLSASQIFGVISFYSYFTDKPVGDFKINVCTGTACFVKGAGKVLDEFSRQLNLKEGETSKDMKYTLGGLRCVGACSLAPVVMVNDKVYGNVTTKMVKSIVADCK